MASEKLTGNDVYGITSDFKLNQINDGNGPRLTAAAADIRITLTDSASSTFDVDLDGAVTLGDVVNKINTSADNGGKVSAELSGGRLVLHDLTGGGGPGPLTVTDINGSSSVRQLGLDATAAGDTLADPPAERRLLVQQLPGDVARVAGLAGVRAGRDAFDWLGWAKTDPAIAAQLAGYTITGHAGADSDTVTVLVRPGLQSKL